MLLSEIPGVQPANIFQLVHSGEGMEYQGVGKIRIEGDYKGTKAPSICQLHIG
jgi:hypothetical protein